MAAADAPSLDRALSGAPARFPGGLREVAPRTWAWLQPNGGLGESNAGLVCGDGASLLVDTPWDERLARRMLAAMAPALHDAPLRHAFVTHPDGDHWWGNSTLGASVEILATPACDRAMRREAHPRVLAGMAATARLLSRAPGRTGAVARRGAAALAPFDFAGVRRRFADRTIAPGAPSHALDPGTGDAAATPAARLGAASPLATLDAGGREVCILDVGPTHTAADAIAHVPDVGVVFAADVLFVGVAPVMWHGPVETWLIALDTLLALDAALYVPGHGPPCGRAEVDLLADYWRWLRDGAHEHRAAGRPAGEAARALLRSPEHARFAAWEGPERILVNVATIYRSLDSGPGELSPPARAKLLVQMLALGHELAGG
jgi:cyclase